MTADRARWSVIWWSDKRKKLIEVEWEHDFNSALEQYIKVKAAGKRLATLRSCNVGFPPPERLMPVEKQRVVVKTKANGKKVRVRETYTHYPLLELNRKDITWCPYCRELRRFRKQTGFHVDGIYVPGVGNFCPVCNISMENHHVRKMNPLLNRSYQAEDLATAPGVGTASRRTQGRTATGAGRTSSLTDEQKARKRERARLRRLRSSK